MKALLKKLAPGIIRRYHDFQRQQRITAYAGNNVQCPVCNYAFREFAPYGLPERKNARCVNCESLERHRLLWKYLHEKTDVFQPAGKIRLLHFAPEKFFHAVFSHSRNIEYVPCDISPEIFNYEGGVPLTKIDITQIPFEANHFDVVLCNHVLEHIPDDRRAMSELFRVMKPGAWGIFQVPLDYNRKTTYEDFSITDAKEREKAFGQNDHVRWYGQDYPERLRSAGFTVNEDAYVQSFSETELHRLGLLPSELIYYCTK